MALHGLTLSSTTPYVSDADPGKGKDGAKVTTFILGPVDVFVSAQVFDRSVDLPVGGRAKMNLNSMNLDYIRFGLRGFEGYLDANNQEIKWETDTVYVSGREYKVVKDSILATFPFEIVQELGRKVQELSTVTQDEAKNS